MGIGTTDVVLGCLVEAPMLHENTKNFSSCSCGEDKANTHDPSWVACPFCGDYIGRWTEPCSPYYGGEEWHHPDFEIYAVGVDYLFETTAADKYVIGVSIRGLGYEHIFGSSQTDISCVPFAKYSELIPKVIAQLEDEGWYFEDTFGIYTVQWDD
jgi:hypothetical protein